MSPGWTRQPPEVPCILVLNLAPMSISKLCILDNELRSMFLKQNSQLNSCVQGKQLPTQNEDEISHFCFTKSECFPKFLLK